VTGAEQYRVYRGTSAGGESRYLQTTGSSTSFKYTGSGETSGAPPATANKWTVKNLLELKNVQRLRVEGNVIEHSWSGGQRGYAVMITPRNSDNVAPWSRVQDVTFVNNIIRHAAGVVEISGYDDTNVSQQARNIVFRNNLMYDIDQSKWPGGAKPILLINEPANVTFDHNTLFHTVSSVVFAEGPAILGFVYTNNIHPHNKYGIMGNLSSPGIPTLTRYFPGANVTYNVFAGGPASSYPSPNAFPTMTQWDASFADVAGEDFRVLSTSVFLRAGSGGSVPGADTGVVETATAGVIEGTPGATPTDGGGGGGTTPNQPDRFDSGARERGGLDRR
jgi:hypothetical protein